MTLIKFKTLVNKYMKQDKYNDFVLIEGIELILVEYDIKRRGTFSIRIKDNKYYIDEKNRNLKPTKMSDDTLNKGESIKLVCTVEKELGLYIFRDKEPIQQVNLIPLKDIKNLTIIIKSKRGLIIKSQDSLNIYKWG